MRQRIESLEQFRALQADYMAARDAEKRKILVCCGTGCVAGGNLNVYHELKKRMDELGIPCEVSLTEHHADTIGLKKSGCHGFCEMGPLVRIEPEGWLYTKCQVSDVEEIIQKTILGGEFIERLGYHQNGELYERQEDIPFYKKQTRRVLEHCGHIDAESIEEYLSIGGYRRAGQGPVRDAAGRDRPGRERFRSARPRRRRLPDREEVGPGRGAYRKNPSSTSSATATRATPARSWTAPCMEGDPHKVIEGMMIAGVRHRRHRGLHLCPRRVSHGRRTVCTRRHRAGQGARLAGRQHPRQRLQLPHAHQPRRRRVRLRRGQRR